MGGGGSTDGGGGAFVYDALAPPGRNIKVIWDTLSADAVPVAVGNDGLVYIGSSNRLFAYDPSSQELLFQGQTPGGEEIHSLAPVSGGGVFVGTGRDGRMLAYTALKLPPMECTASLLTPSS